MKKIVVATWVIYFAFAGLPAAANVNDMLGKWKWNDFMVRCAKGGAFDLSCKVVSGPKNIGMEMIQSKLDSQGKVFFGTIKHPATGTTFKARINAEDPDVWTIHGCTAGAGGACASGNFVRVK